MQATTNFASRDEMRSRLTEQERIERSQQLQKTLALLVHACSCHNPQCSSTSCRKVRALFQHAVQCQQKVTGGCHLCKKMWCLLNLHAKSCTTSDCPVPRCRWEEARHSVLFFGLLLLSVFCAPVCNVCALPQMPLLSVPRTTMLCTLWPYAHMHCYFRRELKDLRRRQTAHIEQKRRAAYASMMRNAATAAAK